MSVIDDYIAKANPFAQPILNHIRLIVHQACPGVEEGLKWNIPYFSYKGMLCGMAAFKNHCAFSFWKGSIMNDPYHLLDKQREHAMGQFGRITHLRDLPPENIIIEYVKEAMRLNEEGVALVKKTIKEKKELNIPDDFMSALQTSKLAFASFHKFTYSKQKEYIEWITEAKQEKTRKSRIETALEWLSEGKSRYWKMYKEKNK